MKPWIGITCKYVYDGSFAASQGMGLIGQQWHMIPHDYIRSVEAAGGIPVLLPVYEGEDTAKELCGRLQGVLFTGGNDINPAEYGCFPEAELGLVTPGRDRQEIALMRYLLDETDLPVMGICRGSQILNVALGGSLCQDLKKRGKNSHWISQVESWGVSHWIRIESGTRLAGILGEGEVGVNSFHHQAVEKVGEGLAVSARSEDGEAEALEYPSRQAFTLGVQWHPECMSHKNAAQAKLFTAFVEAANDRGRQI